MLSTQMMLIQFLILWAKCSQLYRVTNKFHDIIFTAARGLVQPHDKVKSTLLTLTYFDTRGKYQAFLNVGHLSSFGLLFGWWCPWEGWQNWQKKMEWYKLQQICKLHKVSVHPLTLHYKIYISLNYIFINHLSVLTLNDVTQMGLVGMMKRRGRQHSLQQTR